MSFTPSHRQAGTKEVGHQGSQTPQWSAVRRGRPSQDRSRASQGRGYDLRLAALRSLSWEPRRAPRFRGAHIAPAFGSKSKKRSELARISAARTAEHAQAKWKPVRRPGMRPGKRAAALFPLRTTERNQHENQTRERRTHQTEGRRRQGRCRRRRRGWRHRRLRPNRTCRRSTSRSASCATRRSRRPCAPVWRRRRCPIYMARRRCEPRRRRPH